MAVSNTYMRLITGFQARCTIGASVLNATGSPWQTSDYNQPLFYDLSGYDGRITKLGYKSGTALAAAGTVTIDLTALDSPDGTAGAVSLSSLVCLCIQITGTTGKLTIGNAASSGNAINFGAVTNTLTILPAAPGFLFGDPSGVGVTVSGAAKNIKLENTHGSETVDYILIAGGN